MSETSFVNGDYALTPVRQEDIENIRNWRNSQLDVLRQPKPISRAEQQIYYDDNIWPAMRQKEPDTVLLSYFMKGVLIGYGGLVHISWQDRRGEVSFLLDPSLPKLRETYGVIFSNFLELLKRIAFEQLALNRIFTETYDIRDEHIKVLESSGFVREGVMRQHVIINGEMTDSVIHGCLDDA